MKVRQIVTLYQFDDGLWDATRARLGTPEPLTQTQSQPSPEKALNEIGVVLDPVGLMARNGGVPVLYVHETADGPSPVCVVDVAWLDALLFSLGHNEPVDHGHTEPEDRVP